MSELAQFIEAQGRSWEEFQQKQSKRIKAVEDEIDNLAKKANRPPSFTASSQNGEANAIEGKQHEHFFYDAKSKSRVPVLMHGQRLADLDEKKGEKKEVPSLGRVLRGIVLGGRADDASELADERKALSIDSDPSGGFTVSGELSSRWIDSLRAQMVLSRAGAVTVPMGSKTLALARVTGDPVISWHGENGSIPDSDATFGAIELTAKTAVCLVKLSLELSQDSANIEQILSSTINSAMAGAIDRAGLVGVTTNAGAAPSGIMNLANRNKVLSIGAPANWDFLVDGIYELLADNVSMSDIGAFVGHPAIWKKMAKLKTGITNDETPLVAPAEVAALPKLWTTAAPLTSGTTAKGIIANWSDLLFGVRKDITVRVLSETFMGSNLQVAVLAYARVDFAAMREQSFCTLEGITV